LNKVIKRKIYPLLKIQNILIKCPGYKYFTNIDILMQHCTFELSKETKDLCVIITPFGNYLYERVTMGVKQSPGFAQ
jgi:hypothetical protein